MTPRQIERLRKKIADIKKSLAAEKRKFGGYDDSRALRYLPPKYFIQLQDFTGGLAYLKWFSKQFPDDVGFPDFLFEWAIILFKNGKTRACEFKIFEAFCSNTYILDKYFGNAVIPIDKYEHSDLPTTAFLNYFEYAARQKDLEDFTIWLRAYINTAQFKDQCIRYIDIYKKLKTESDPEARAMSSVPDQSR